MKKGVLLCGFLGLVHFTVFSQSIFDTNSFWSSYNIRNLGVEDGMPDEEIYYIYEDDTGFLWMANIDGLVRYDGLSLKQFNKGYAGGSLYEIYPAEDGGLWIPSIGEGLYKFDGDTLIRFKDELSSTNGFVKSMSFINDTTLVLGLYGSGLSFFDGEKEIKNYTTDDGLVSTEIWKIITDKDGRLWIGTNDGISIYENGSFTNFTVENGLPFNNIRGLTEMMNGDVWVGTDKEGIVIFRDDKPFKYLTTADGLSDSDPQYFAQNPVDSSIWIAHHGGGLDRYKDGKIENLNTDDGLVSNFLTYVGFTKNGIGLVGSETGVSILTNKLVTVFDENSDGITISAIATVHQSGDGTVWLGSDGGGFFYYEEGDDKWSVIESPGTSGNYTNGYSSANTIDAEGNIWFGTPGTGIVKIKDQRVVAKLSDEDGLLDNFSRCLAVDSNDNLWIGTNRGVNVFNKDLEQIESYTSENGLPNDFCLTMMSDSEGRVWYGSFGGGLALFENDNITKFDTTDGLPSNNIFSFLEYSDGSIFIGTGGFGLSQYKDGELFNYGANDGIPPQSISGIAEDNDKMLWFATASGIYHADPAELTLVRNGELEKMSYTQYTTDDGLLSNKMEPANNATITRLSNGDLLFASVRGAVLVNPENSKISTESFIPYIDEFIVDEKSLGNKNPRELTPKDKKIEISYSALNLMSPGKTKFRVKLDGIDENWVFVGDRTSAYYDYLPDGDYAFHVSAIGPDGQWSDKTASLAFTVLPPFYKTWWFMTLGFLGFIAIGAGGVQIRSNLKLQRLNRELETQQKIQAERERISRELHDNVGSQITNLITGIEVSNLHIKKNQQGEALSLLENLDSDARSAMTDLRETIWLLDKESVEFELFYDHLNGYIKRQKRYLNGLKVQLNSDLKKNCILEPGQSMNLTRIIQEALKNTRKYAEATEFKISFSLKEKILSVTIADNGIGMNIDENLEKGNGLKNMAHRAEEMGGFFQINSDENMGTEIKLELTVKIP